MCEKQLPVNHRTHSLLGSAQLVTALPRLTRSCTKVQKIRVATTWPKTRLRLFGGRRSTATTVERRPVKIYIRPASCPSVLTIMVGVQKGHYVYTAAPTDRADVRKVIRLICHCGAQRRGRCAEEDCLSSRNSR